MRDPVAAQISSLSPRMAGNDCARLRFTTTTAEKTTAKTV